MEAAGGRDLELLLEHLRIELDDYFGAIAEVQMGGRQTVPEPPEALLYYQMCNRMHMPLVDGGIWDQPHIWLMEYGICETKAEFYENQNRSSEDKPPPTNDRYAQDYPTLTE